MMPESKISYVTFLIVATWSYVLIQASILAVQYIPTEADSLWYHIPLAHSILDGSFVTAEYGSKMHMYFPAASESILAVLLALRIPVGYFNILGILALSGASYMVGRSFDLDRQHALTFMAVIGTLYGVVRWVHAQTVDIWLAAYYLAAVALFKKPTTSWSYFLNLGIVLGLLIGSKYSGPLFAVGLLGLFGMQNWQMVRDHWRRAIGTLSFIFLIGGFWYIRNWLVKENPVFPLDTPLFPGVAGNEIIAVPVWRAFIKYPGQMLDGAISEFGVWPLVGIGLVGYLGLLWLSQKWGQISIFSKGKNALLSIELAGLDPNIYWHLVQLSLLVVWNFVVFLLLPSGDSMQLHVSQYRFSYVVISLLILMCFVLAQRVSAVARLIQLAVLGNILVISAFPYRPKIMLVVIIAFYLYEFTRWRTWFVKKLR